MKSEGIIIGVWSRWENNGKWGKIVVEKTYKGETKAYMLKVLGSQQCDNVDIKWETAKGVETKFTYGLTKMGVDQYGKEHPSQPVVYGINEGGGEPQREEPLKVIQREEAIEDDDTLPF
jgi:hypothetical protein